MAEHQIDLGKELKTRVQLFATTVRESIKHVQTPTKIIIYGKGIHSVPELQPNHRLVEIDQDLGTVQITGEDGNFDLFP
jgi:hypothetical protein